MAASDVFGIVGTTQAGNFHVERVVAEGGFGVVYRAQHGAFRAPVAIKCLKIPEQMTKQQRAVFLEKFREEAELMFRLSAAITEVVRPLHVDVLQLPDGRFVPFLALEWLEGESLDGIITRRREQGQAPLGLHKVVKMLRPVASALSRAHRFPGPQGAISIIHRDLKPENIFVASIGGNESMKILDFGIAKAKRAASQAVGRITGRSLEEDESASFTPAYGAPEQWSPKTYGETGPWTDVWGLALTLVEALCGMPPIDGDTYVMRRICLDDKRRPTARNLGADVPIEVDRVIERAVAVDPRKRFNDIESFWSELEIAMGLEPSLRTRDARREPSDTPAAEKLGPGLTTTGQRLAKIELKKASLASPLPGVRIQGDPRPPPRLVSDVPAPSSSRPSREPPQAPPAEDWSSLGLDANAPASTRNPHGRKPAIGMEMPLPSRASSAELEAVLPTRPDSAPPPPREHAPREAPRAPVRRNTAELEIALPMHGDGPPPPAMTVEPAPRAQDRRSLTDLEAALPTMDLPPTSARSLDVGASMSRPDTSSARPARVGDELDFDLGGGAPPPSVRPLPAISSGIDVASSRRPEMLRPRVEAREPMSLRERLKAPLSILLVSLAVALVAFGFQKITGNPLLLGPVRPTWIAGPLALFGVGFLLFRLIGVHEDD
jgi:eukaryotic-like serine/threonine-protein kinase